MRAALVSVAWLAVAIPAAAGESVELALDVAGGRDKCYLYGPPDRTNWNHLWSVRPAGDGVMFVSKVDNMALDANGGAGNPYPRAADPTNMNHVWLLARVGDDYMIWSTVTNVVLDANGGRGRPYLSTNPDPRNVNHLWSLRPAGEYVMIVPKVRRPAADHPAWEVGRPVPSLSALLPDGSPLLPDHFKGKTVLMSFWSLKDPNHGRQFATLRGLRHEFRDAERFQMVSVCTDDGDGWDDWLKFLDRQPPLDERFPRQRFGSDARWWQAFHMPAGKRRGSSAPARGPSVLIGPDGRLLAVRVPDERIREVVSKALKSTPSGPPK